MRFSTSTALSLSLALLAPTTFSSIALAKDGTVPTVTVDIAPVQSLVASVMGDLGEPHLLVPPGGSPHGYALRPSDARAISESDLVVWVGHGLSPFLAKPLEALGDGAKSLEMEDVEGIQLLPYRPLAALEPEEEGHDEHDHDHADGEHEHEHEGHDHEGEEHDDGHHHKAGDADPHMWLLPDNAQALVTAVEKTLSEMDPDHAATYAANAEATRARLTALKGWMVETLAPLADKRYVVFHNAYQYLEPLGGPKAAAALTLSPEVNPGAGHLVHVREALAEGKIACVFSEPQFPAALVEQVVEGTKTGTAVLDPLGASVPLGPDQYETTMRALTQSLADCLSANPG
jgi:zinc transport system substrate-binding protein